MRWNREKLVAALALIVLLGGVWRLVIGFLTPTANITVPDIHLPEFSREIPPPRVPEFVSGELPKRNPFGFEEGWRPLETMPLAPPPLVGPGRMVPALGSPASRPGGARFLWVEGVPREIGVRRGGAGSSSGSGTDGSAAQTPATDTRPSQVTPPAPKGR